jgi:hypothetical protein
MRPRLHWLPLACIGFAAVGLPALGSDDAPSPTTPPLLEPLPFDHQGHERSFAKAGLTCTSCHPVGAQHTEQASPEDATLPPPRSSCHACHLQIVEHAPKRAPDACMRCHSSRDALEPESHRVAWDQEHGEEAMARGAHCDRCHDTTGCVACHEERGATASSPHGPGFGAFHGVEARVDPQRCSSCHQGASCTRCHQGGSLSW